MPFVDPEQRRIWGQQYYLKNKQKKLDHNRQWRLDNKEWRTNYKREYRLQNLEAYKLRDRLRYEKVPRPPVSPERRVEINARRKERYHSDPIYKLRVLLRNRQRGVIAQEFRSAKTMQLLGAGLDVVIGHLKKKFRQPMSLKNMGSVWEIDHVRPLSSFDLSKPQEQAIALHYTNLQPLFVTENRRKGAKIT